MATITVLKFKTPQGAEETLDLVKGLSKQQLINLHDAAIVTWPEGKKKPKTKHGIDDDFIKSVQQEVTEGTSALFLMTSDAVVDKVADAFKGIEFQLTASNLSNAQEAQLREAFGA
jgi:uncharacterized membrane protein